MSSKRPHKVTFASLVRMMQRGQRIAVLTGYDAKDASLLDEAGVDIILVGDSIGSVRLGYPDTTYVTLDEMAEAVKSVTASEPSALVVADMPIHSYDTPEMALKSAMRLLDCGGDAVKLEGGVDVSEVVQALVKSSVPVMGHIAHTPQTDLKHQVEGRNESEAQALLRDALALEAAGVFAIVMELVDADVARRVTESVSVPTIGIGAGARTDGQVLVLDDLLGWTDFKRFPKGKPPTFLGTDWDRSSPQATVKQYIERVRAGTFPGEKESYRVYKG